MKKLNMNNNKKEHNYWLGMMTLDWLEQRPFSRVQLDAVTLFFNSVFS